MATNNFSSTIIVEPLTFDNYKSWSAWMKNYLLAQDLWDIVEGTVKPEEDDSKAWRKNNAAALHAIQISCAPNILSKIEIEDISSAKTVWDKLAKMCGPEILQNVSSATEPVEQPAGSVNNDLLDQYERLRTAINNGDSVAAIDFPRNQEDAKSTARMSVKGRTLLHVAVFAGQTEIVEKLVELMLVEELEIRDDKGFTALAWATILEKLQMVKCMLGKNFYLFNIEDGENRTPLIAALAYGNIEMANYLYSFSLSYNIPNDRISSDIHDSTVLTQFIFLNQFDLALHFLKDNPRAAILPNLNNTFALSVLAMKSSAFLSGNKLTFWEKWIYDACIPIQSVHCAIDHTQIESNNPNEHQNDQEGIIRSGIPIQSVHCAIDHTQIEINNPNERQKDQEGIIRSELGRLRWLPSDLLKPLGIKQIYEMKLLHRQARDLLSELCNEVQKMKDDVVIEAMFEATKGGIVEFIEELVKADTSLLHYRDRMGRNILFYAVIHRQPKIVSYIYKKVKAKNSIANVVDKSGSTILHMAAMLAPSTTRDRLPSEALKMQSEIRWFKEVERICPSWIKKIRNDTKMTAKELFTHNHMNMMKGGEKWTKETASAFTVVGALIVTIMFTAAFTVPGGNNQDSGFPMFSQKKLFTVFIIADALSLFASSISVLVFLEIVTSRYAEEDFLQSLPLKMIGGYYTLFFSITTMMIAFCAGLFVMLPEKSWMVIPTICLACFTVRQFAVMLSNFVDYILKQMDESSSPFA